MELPLPKSCVSWFQRPVLPLNANWMGKLVDPKLVLKCFEPLKSSKCEETLSIAERQQMELVKLYPNAVELEMWIKAWYY